jgi:hypothetical protein
LVFPCILLTLFIILLLYLSPGPGAVYPPPTRHIYGIYRTLYLYCRADR